MRFPSTFLDEIRDRLRISEVIGQRVQFDKKKTNPARGDYWACCPFHGEKTPSFHCEDRKGRYHCFGCGVSGDHFRFLVELDGLAFPEAVERLAAQAGLPMPVMNEREQKLEKERVGLMDVMEMAAAYFRDQLQGPAGAKARAYLRDRGLSSAIQQYFGIGYAPDNRNSLKEFLASKDVGQDLIERCGLVAKREDNPLSYDRFRDRIMFPIPNARGNTIAFGGRAMAPDAMAKYLNSPETELFHKSNVLYNFANARKTAYSKKQVIVAEGYMDVIALHSAGFENAVAPLGTALTERQMALLWKMNDEPLLCFDGDQAGLSAAYRAIDLVLPSLSAGRSVRFALLPEGRDPDDLLREEGTSAMEAVLNSAQALSDMLWRRETASGDFYTPEKRAELERKLKATVGQIKDEDVRRYYGQDMRERLNRYFAGSESENGRSEPYRSQYSARLNSRTQFPNRPRNSGYPSRRTGVSQSLLNSSLLKKNVQTMGLREAALVAGVLFHPAVAVAKFEEFSSVDFQSSTARALQSVVLDILAEWDGDEVPGRDVIKTRVVNAGLSESFVRLEQQLRNSRLWQYLPEAAYEDALDGWNQAYILHLRSRTLSSELKSAETMLADEKSEEAWQRVRQIKDELAQTEGTEALIEGFGVSSGRPAGTY